MRQVHVLETFEDIEHALSQVGGVEDNTRRVKENAILAIRGGQLTLESKNFVLADDVRQMGNEFVLYCINKVMGKSFSADKLQT